MGTGRYLLMVLAVAALTFCTGPAAVTSAATPIDLASPPAPSGEPAAGFATPEDAIRAYLSGVAHGDVSGILEACAIDEMSTGFKFDQFVDRIKALMPATSLAPSDHPFFAEMDKVILTDRILGQVRMLVYSVLTTEKMDGTVIVPFDKARAQTFASQIDPSRLAGLTIEDIAGPNATFEHDPTYLAHAAQHADMYGADELTERVVIFTLDGKRYGIGFTLLRYGSGWKVSDQSSPLAGTPVLGTAQLLP